MQSRLLSHIAFKFTNQPENIANEALCFILRSDKIAVKKMLEVIGRDELLDEILDFRTEMSTDGNGRPDITAIGLNQGKPLIIEGKFWACLTENQPNNYLEELNKDGALLFVCPSIRKSRLKDEVGERIQQVFEYVSSSYYRAEVGGRMVYVLDWTQVLCKIDEYASVNVKPLSNDIHQLMDLCERMDSEAFLPISYSDLNEYHGRICYQFSKIVNSVREALRNRPYANFDRLKATAWEAGYGFYFKIHDFGCQFYFTTYKWHKHNAKTPYWVKIQTSKWKSDPTISDLFKVAEDFKESVFVIEDTAQIAIHLKVGLDRNNIIDFVVATIDKIACVLSAHSHQYHGLTPSYPLEDIAAEGEQIVSA